MIVEIRRNGLRPEESPCEGCQRVEWGEDFYGDPQIGWVQEMTPDQIVAFAKEHGRVIIFSPSAAKLDFNPFPDAEVYLEIYEGYRE